MKICLLSWITYLLVTWWPKSARSPLRKLVKMAGSLMSSVSALASPQKMGIIQQQEIWGSQKGHHRCWDFGNFSKWFWDDRVASFWWQKPSKTHQANYLGTESVGQPCWLYSQLSLALAGDMSSEGNLIWEFFLFFLGIFFFPPLLVASVAPGGSWWLLVASAAPGGSWWLLVASMAPGS